MRRFGAGVVAAPVASPYGVPVVAVGSYFKLRVVFRKERADLAAIKVYVYADRDAGAVPLHEAIYAYPPAAAADYRIGNLECPIATGGRALENKIYTFRAAPAGLSVLAGRFDAMGLANNHSGDYGRNAFVQTLALLGGSGIRHFGGGRGPRRRACTAVDRAQGSARRRARLR